MLMLLQAYSTNLRLQPSEGGEAGPMTGPSSVAAAGPDDGLAVLASAASMRDMDRALEEQTRALRDQKLRNDSLERQVGVGGVQAAGYGP